MKTDIFGWSAAAMRRCCLTAEPAGPGLSDDIPERHWEFIESACVNYHECSTHFFVHAGVYPEVSLAEQPDDMLVLGAVCRPRAARVG